jgi:uncharacterized membrane protein SpoIIM required for sporulation
MVLEGLISPLRAEERPWILIIIGLLYSSIGILVARWVFNEYATMVMVFLIVLPSVPLIYAIIKIEEKKDLEINDERGRMFQHSKALSALIFLFIGVSIGLTLWFVLMPPEIAANVFKSQLATIKQINAPTGAASSYQITAFGAILMNNIKVLIFCILFSFFYGIGAIFILTWNASVIAAAMGTFVKQHLLNTNLVAAMSFGILRYFIHGIPEILAYFIGGLAGGIISIAVIKHHFSTKKFGNILVDSSDLIILAIVVLVLSALIEVFITPALF